jgi:uncharacterized integral membrane protein
MSDDDRPVPQGSSRDVGAIIRLALAGVLVLLLAAFAIDNRRSVRVGWVFGDFRAPMIVVLLVTAAMGVLIGWLILYRARRTGRRNQRDDD